MSCIITEKQSIQINTFNNTKDGAHDSQLVRAKENHVELRWAQPTSSIRQQQTNQSFTSGMS